jgi:hypothetical protein
MTGDAGPPAVPSGITSPRLTRAARSTHSVVLLAFGGAMTTVSSASGMYPGHSQAWSVASISANVGALVVSLMPSPGLARAPARPRA